jgi:NAD(P)-dependent dehydrogenase (short-subunit alcohol dehydrogenase family)
VQIAGKVAVVSGGGSGIGRAAVLALAERGAAVVVADVDVAGGQETLAMAQGSSGTAIFQRCDVTRTEDLDRAFVAAVKQLGRLDIAFNNAGIGGEDLFADEAGTWKRLIAVDLTAVIDATRIAVREMKRAGNGGVIVNTASLIGLEPMGLAPVYSAAKAGVVNFTRALVYLLDEANIRVNALCPEIVATPMTRGAAGDEQIEALIRRGEILKPEDIAAALIELIEDDTRFGAALKVTVQGGREYAAF